MLANARLSLGSVAVYRSPRIAMKHGDSRQRQEFRAVALKFQHLTAESAWPPEEKLRAASHPRGRLVRSIAEVGRSVQLGLIIDRKARDMARIEVVISRQMFPKRHALDAGVGHVDRLQP